MKIGELSRVSGCQPGTIRYYEKEGLMPSPGRGTNNYRIYGQEDARRLQFIAHCRRHGLSLADIAALLEAKDEPADGCQKAHALVNDCLNRIEEKIQSLQELREELLALKNSAGCAGRCAILSTLEDCEGCRLCKGKTKKAGVDAGQEKR